MGSGPSEIYYANHVAEMAWNRWRSNIIDRLAEQATILEVNHGYIHGLMNGPKTEVSDKGTVICLDYQPIKRGVTKAEIVAFLKSPKSISSGYLDKDLADRIEREGIID